VSIEIPDGSTKALTIGKKERVAKVFFRLANIRKNRLCFAID